MAIKRVWHGWTTPENAGPYWDVLRSMVIPGIEAKGIDGYRGIEVLRRDQEDEVEFVTIMTFDSIDSVIDFNGEDYETAYVPPPAREVLHRWDEKVAHYEVVSRPASDGGSSDASGGPGGSAGDDASDTTDGLVGR